jgi:hypothetical protein
MFKLSPGSTPEAPEYIPVRNYDVLFNQMFLTAYCEEPPRPIFPNVNGRIKLRKILKMFNDFGDEGKRFRSVWFNTPCFVSESLPLRMPTKEEQIEAEYLYRFDIYWGIVTTLLPQREDVSMDVIRQEIKSRTTDKQTSFKLRFPVLHRPMMDKEPECL